MDAYKTVRMRKGWYWVPMVIGISVSGNTCSHARNEYWSSCCGDRGQRGFVIHSGSLLWDVIWLTTSSAVAPGQVLVET